MRCAWIGRTAGCEVSFNYHDYAAIEYGYRPTVQKAEGTTVDRSFVPATPTMGRHPASPIAICWDVPDHCDHVVAE